MGGASRPAWVYIHAAALDLEEVAKMERRVFGKDELVISSQHFDCYRIEASELSEDERKRFARRLPAFVLFDTDGRVLADLQGASSPDSLTGFLGKGYRTIYGQSLPPRVARLDDLLKRMERAEDRVAQTTDQVRKLAESLRPDKPKDQERLEEAREEHAAAQAELAKLREERAKLLEPPESKS